MLTRRISSGPAESRAAQRPAVYRLLELPEPAEGPSAPPVPLPTLLNGHSWSAASGSSASESVRESRRA
jgi:hypothetical protein